MQKYIFSVFHNLLADIKEFKKYENLETIRTLLNNEIPTANCVSVSVNDSPRSGTFYGIIVFPKVILRDGIPTSTSYAIEIQRATVDLLSPQELAALIIHDVSHNILSTTVIERMKLAIIKACRMTNMKIVDIMYNMDNKIWDVACLDIANRTFKTKVIPGLDMYEPDRLLVDMDICGFFNSAVDKMATVDYLNLMDPAYQDQSIADTHVGAQIVKMVREKLRNIPTTYKNLMNFVKAQYDTKIFDVFPVLTIEPQEDRFGEEVLDEEELKPFELQMLQEGVVTSIKSHGQSKGAEMLIEAAFSSGNISYSALQRELDILNFKISSITSNYERLAVLDRIYDNIFALEKYLDKKPDDTLIWDYLKKFINITDTLKDAKIMKRKYGVFVEVPPGYEG